jgi:hypothetical protein
MSRNEYYRQEARRCREFAAMSPGSPVADRWRKLAAEYDLLAESMTYSGFHESPGVTRTPMRQQPVQQQQTKAGRR